MATNQRYEFDLQDLLLSLHHKYLQYYDHILSFIMALSVLLIMAGDVEINPGPKINDRPTVEMLRSFFQSIPTWKLIVILLPEIKYVDYINVTTSFVNEAKQQEALFSKWLELCPHASWEDVLDVLKVRGDDTQAQCLLNFLDQKQSTTADDAHFIVAAQPIKTPLMDTSDSTNEAPRAIKQDSVLLDLVNKENTPLMSNSKEVFRTSSDKLANSITDNVYLVTDALFAKGLIPRQTKEDVFSITGKNDYCKASQLVAVLGRQLEASPDPERYLIDVCHILAASDTTLHNIASRILQSLGHSNPDKVLSTYQPDNILAYINNISDYYKSQPIVASDWPPHVGKEFCGRLALVVKSHNIKQADRQKIAWSMLRGKIDEIVRLPIYEEIPLDDILKPTGSQSLRVVVDGPPGIGKTTLCCNLCNMWANGELKHQTFDLVLHCPLRNNKIAQATTLPDLFVCQYDEVSLVAKWFSKKNGEGLLIIFDGWDELSVEHRRTSLITSIICREQLPKCSVVVTSRSYASSSLLLKIHSLSKHVQVIGFSEEEIRKVVRGTLDPQLAEKLVNDLSVRSDVQSLCYVPLVCSMVILIYDKREGHLPTTLTELYENFILQTIRRHLEKTNSSTEPQRLLSLDKLPQNLFIPLRDMCHFAYDSLKKVENRMTFHTGDLPASVSNEDYLGLVTSMPEYDEEISQFLHLSIQEFLAAWWIAKYESEIAEVFLEHFDNDHFRMCLRFVAGLTHLKPEKNYQEYFNKPFDLQCKRRPLFGFDALHESWFHQNPEIRSSSEDHYYIDKFDNHAILLIQLLYESQNINHCKILAQSTINHSLCFHRTTLSLFDTLCLAYYITNSNSTWNHIHLGEFSHQHQIIFNSQLVANNVRLEKRIEVKLTEPTNETIHNLLTLPFIQNISECYLDILRGNYSPCHVFIDLLQLLKLKILHLSIVSTTFSSRSSEGYDNLAKCLEENDSLKELKYEYSGEDEMTMVVAAVVKGLMNNKTLTSFSLAVCNSYDKNRPPPPLPIGTIEQLLSKNHTLQALKLSDDLLPSEIEIVEINTPLTALEIGREDVMVSLLPHIKGLRCLSLPWSYPMPSLFTSHPCLEQLTIPIDNYSTLISLFDLLQKKQNLKAARIIIKDGVDIADGWYDWSKLGFNPIADISKLFSGVSQTLHCFELILPYENYLEIAALYGCLSIGFLKFPCLEQMRIALPLPEQERATQFLPNFFVMIKNLTEFQINYVPEGHYDSRSIGSIQTSRFYEVGLPLVSNHSLTTQLSLRHLSIDCTHLQNTDKMETLWVENVIQFFRSVYLHPSLEYVKVPNSMKQIFESEVMVSIICDKPIIEFQ